MKELRSFFMEDTLEDNRLSCRYNHGESGAQFQTVGALLSQCGLTQQEILSTFVNMPLYDSPNWGRSDLRQQIADFHPGAQLKNVLVTTGTSEALFLLFRALRPQKVALIMPAFQLLYEIPQAIGSQVVPLPMRWDEEGKPYYSFSEWESILVKEKPDCFLINCPHNPSGVILRDGELERLHQLAQQWDAYVVGDEHYRFLSHTEKIVGRTLYKRHPRVFVTGSFIKCLGAPGLRIGWCVGDTSILKIMQNEKNYTTHTVNPVSEWIAQKVTENLEVSPFPRSHSLWLQQREILAHHLESSRALLGAAPEGGLVSVVGLRVGTSESRFRVAQTQLQQRGIFALPLCDMEFGQSDLMGYAPKSMFEKGIGFRFGLGTCPEKLEEALNIMEDMFAP